MASNTKKDLVLITNVETNKFYKKLLKTLKFDKDPRIKFVGTVYDEQLLKKIREDAYAYIHGHSVGGTNPSLLEALASTKLNLLYDVGFNKECGGDSCLYRSKEPHSLEKIITEVDSFNENTCSKLDSESTSLIKERYDWTYIVKKYEEIF